MRRTIPTWIKKEEDIVYLISKCAKRLTDSPEEEWTFINNISKRLGALKAKIVKKNELFEWKKTNRKHI